MKNKDNSIVLLSGGLDSSLSFLKALKNTQVLFALTFNYGQKSAKKEIAAAKKICAFYKIKHKVLTLPFLKQTRDHPLFNNKTHCPTLKLTHLDKLLLTKKSAKAVWVPNRNGLFINIAASLAEELKASIIYTGFNKEEAATFPDNSKNFVSAINKSLAYSTLFKVKVVAPTIHFNKKRILKSLLDQGFPIKYLWSCYNGYKRMCGTCESCLRLKRAFTQLLRTEQ